jgi:putative DNA primase/helicase
MADGIDFSPLSDGERREAAQEPAACGEQYAAKPALPPTDAEAPEAAAARLFGRSPSGLWRYMNAAAALAFCVCRWNDRDGGKDIRPLTWFDGEGWRLAQWADGRPLYGADRIAAAPDARVVVTQGEKAADAAAGIFPKSIPTTSSGGANAAGKSD